MSAVEVRAPATETDVTVAARHRAHEMAKSYVPRRETVPREARLKNLRTNYERAPREARFGTTYIWCKVQAARNAAEKLKPLSCHHNEVILIIH